MKQPVSAVIITLNAAKQLEACLQSLSFCDEIVVVDSGSTDETIALADRYQAKVVEQAKRATLTSRAFRNDRSATFTAACDFARICAAASAAFGSA